MHMAPVLIIQKLMLFSSIRGINDPFQTSAIAGTNGKKEGGGLHVIAINIARGSS